MKTRLLHLHWSGGIGGIERWLLTLSRYLDHDRFDLTIALMNRSGIVLDEARREGARVVEFGWGSGRSPFKAMAFRRFLKRERFDLIHNHLRTWLVGWALKSTEAPRIMHEHGLLLYNPTRSQGMYDQFGFLYDRFITTNLEMEERLQDRVPACRGRLHLLPNPVDVEDFQPSSTHRTNPSSNLVIGGIGRLEQDKDWSLFLRTARALVDQRPNLVFRIMGGGPQRDMIAAEVNDLNLGDHLTLLAPDGNPAQYYRDLDVLIFTSLKEDFGMVVLEALASGTPVVLAPPEAGGAKAFLNNLPGIMASTSRDPEAVAQSTLELLDSSELRKDLAVKGRQAVKERFGAPTWARQLEGLYDEVLSDRAKGSE